MATQEIVFDDLEIGEIAMDLDHEPPQEILDWGMDIFRERLVLVTSLQRNSLALLDMAYKINPEIHVLTVNTGRLPEETISFIDEVREEYPKAHWRIVHPDHREVEEMVERKGMNLFYDSVPNRFLCCHIRKVRPLTNELHKYDAWITGLRRDEWASRSAIDKVELDHDHDGIVKLNPLADWTEEEVIDYIRDHDVPEHPLYAKGYSSIGCAPCSRPIKDDENTRSGRWWWEEGAPKECGMNCPISTGNFEREAEQIFAEVHENGGVVTN
ncbi:MAG TPA: phosphoadenylyl-sulfate reductase [Fodinibius sp.]|nr:phosphoadenylyl-sulfate reductase [Fodinibius sp.]